MNNKAMGEASAHTSLNHGRIRHDNVGLLVTTAR